MFGPFSYGVVSQGVSVVQILDQFTDTNGVLLPSHVIAPTNTPGASWVNQLGNCSISSNRATATNAGANYATLNTGISDATIVMNVVLSTVASNYLGPVWRWQDVNNHWRLVLSPDRGASDDWFLISVTAGVTSVPASGQLNLATGSSHTITTILNGSSVIIAVDSTEIVNTSSALFQTNVVHGIVVANVANPAAVDTFNLTSL